MEKQLVQNSCNTEVILEAIPDYQKELDRCAYSYKLSYNQPTKPVPKKSRGPSRETWLNPPYSLDVEKNVTGEFLKLVDKHFPPNHPLHSMQQNYWEGKL